MRDEFTIDRHGKQHVLYAGLLDEAHAQGLVSIDVELLQVPSKENGGVAIAKAKAVFPDGKYFSGIGDASPENVGRNIVPHLIRMSETRAKARALRDAVNIGATSLEETGGDDGESSAGQGRENVRQMPSRSNQSAGGGDSGGVKPMTEAQGRYLKKLCDDTGHDMPDTDGFAARDASELIERLKGQAG